MDCRRHYCSFTTAIFCLGLGLGLCTSLLICHLYSLNFRARSCLQHNGIVTLPNLKAKTQFVQYDVAGFQWENKSKARMKLVDGLGIYPSIPVYDAETIKESELYNYLVQKQILCDRQYRAGNLANGGWNVCLVGNFKPKSGCLVYSFGINYDFSFDDAMVKQFNCTVYSFDPSMERMKSPTKRGDYIFFIPEGLSSSKTVTKDGWKMDTLDGFMQRFGHSKHIIDYLKMDIEFSEHAVIPQIIKSGKFSQVKQLGFELHRNKKVYEDTPNQNASKIYALLQSLEEEGFRKWHFHYNPEYGYLTQFGKDTSTNIEMYFINTNFLK